MDKKKLIKEEILKNVFLSSRLYKKYLINKKFLLIYGTKCIELRFFSENFLHLTGLSTKLSAEDFFNLCIDGKLTTNQFIIKDNFADLIYKKNKNLLNLHKIISIDSVLLEDFKTKTRFYEIGVTEFNYTLCFGKISNNYEFYIPFSNRTEKKFSDVLDRANEAYFVDFIFEKKPEEELYSKINFKGKNAKFPENLKHLIDNDLLDDLL